MFSTEILRDAHPYPVVPVKSAHHGDVPGTRSGAAGGV